MVRNWEKYKSQANELKGWIRENFTEEKMYKQMAENIFGEKILEVKIEDLPRVSIITSVYNGDEFIRPFLEDITRQTIFEEKCELILINANSPGNEEGVIKEYLGKYPDNIIYKKLEEDPGIYAVWNIGVDLSSGEFLTNANLDDRKSPNSIELHAIALYTDQDVDLVYSDMLVTHSPNESWEDNTSQDKRYNMAEFSYGNLKMGNMPHAAPLWRRSLHEKYGKFDEKYKSAGDWEMWLRAASRGSLFKKINSVCNLYYFNPSGISTNPDNFSWKMGEEREIHKKYQIS
jgi:glycosyltransferase involved in cell wall biosynthesis